MATVADFAQTEQRDADVCHMGQIADRPLRRHPRGYPPVKQCQQRFYDRALNAGLTLAIVDDGAADNGAGLLIAQRFPYAAGVTHQRVAGQLRQLFAVQCLIAKRPQAGIDAIGTLFTGDNFLNDGLRIVDTRPGSVRQVERCLIPGYRHHVLPA
ncbi:hypothetical protein D3C80_1435570 [compost metagenome]